jgi:heat shock protein HspQ
MNIQIDHIESGFAVNLATPNDFHIARSVFLDAFSELEIVVCKLLSTAPSFKGNEKKPFGHRVEELKNLTPSPKISKEKCAKISDKITRIHLLLSIRSDIVHSRIELANVDGVMHAKICNNIMSIKDQPYIRLINLQNFKAYSSEAKRLANELNQMLNQPSVQKTTSP